MKRTITQDICFLMLLIITGLWNRAGAQEASIISALAAAPPQINGKLEDDTWPAQPQIANFFVTGQSKASPKPIQVWLCHDEQALYMAFKVKEPQPQLLKHTAPQGSREVWRDDCVEIFIRTGDSVLDFDQFIVNCAGIRQSERCRQGVRVENWQPQWPAAAHIGADYWIVEVALPWQLLEMSPPAPGTLIQLSLGREDYTKTGPALVNWPAGSAYGSQGSFGRLYLGTDNVLVNPDFSVRQDGKTAGWSFGDNGADGQFFSSVSEGGQAVIHFRSPGRYAVAQQNLRLRPNAIYRLQAEVRGTAGAYLRARTSARRGEPSTPYDIWARPAEQYQFLQVNFPTGETGEALIIIGATENTGVGDVYIRNLKVMQDISLVAEGPAIAVKAGQPVRIVKLLVSDCRACRGFVTAPIDGRLDSYNWDMGRWEYNQPGAGAGVGYRYNNNEGLHITLADKGGVDAVQMRGGARVKLYANAERYDNPGRAPLVWEFGGRSPNVRALFPQRVRSDRFSFFGLTNGLIADCSFLRLENSPPKGQRQTPWTIGAEAAPDSLVEKAQEKRFGEKERTILSLVATAPQPLKAPARQAIHLLTAPLRTEMAYDAISVRLRAAQPLTICPLTIAIQDPFNPLHELMSAECELTGGQDFEIICDFPDQIVPAQRRVWLTLTFGAEAAMERLEITPYTVPRAQALPEALAYRKLLMRGLFCQLSEARQWTTLRRDPDLEKFYQENRWGPGVRELHGSIAFCKQLAPEDELVRVYDEWVWRTARELPPWPPKLDVIPGAPEWAVLLRQAWLANRAVCQWWLDNRLVPTGEFGGLVGDDTDMYQNYADLPMFEKDGTGGAVVEAAAQLAELAEKENLEQGLNKHTTDPLHAYEEGVNHEALMLWWRYGDPVYFERCLLAAKSLPKTTVVTPRGHRHFKSQMIGAEDLRIDRPLDVDGGAHPLMWHPALEVAWYNGSPRVLQYLDEWASGWLEHNEPGQYATAVDVKAETTKETSNRPLYGGYSSQACVHTFLYFLTDNKKYLQPFRDFLQKGEAPWPMKNFLPELWQRGFLDEYPDVSRFISLHPVSAAAGLGKKETLIDALKADITELQRFWWMYTGAEPFTDRVFLYSLQNVAIAYTGGYATRNKFNHTHAVSWEGFGTDYAALVLQARRNRFKAIVYNFANRPLSGRFRLWLLEHGRYLLRQGIDANGDDQMEQATRQENVEVGRATALPLTLPPKQITVLELEQIQKLDELTERADLALSPLEIHLEGDAVQGIAHNIGARDVSQFTIALVDAQGRQQAKQTLGPLAAPVDLEPKRLPFRFSVKSASIKGWRVVVDPENNVPEIFEENNSVRIEGG